MPNDRPGNSKAAARRERALELRIEGKSYRSIGRDLGVSHVQASRYVQQALAESAARSVLRSDQLRELELLRLDEQVDALWGGKAEPQAANALIRLGERRSKLLGLDAPSQVQHSIDPGEVRTVSSVLLRVGVSKFGIVIQAIAGVLNSSTDPALSPLAGVYELAVAQREAWLVEAEAAVAQLPSGEQAA